VLQVGLTGGIGAGKSAVSRYFRELGAHILDADRLARELLAPDSPVLQEVVAALGEDLLDGDGCLDRNRLAGRIFADDSVRQQLEAILHPRINALARERAAAIGHRLPHAVIIYEAPLLLESGADAWVDRVVVVDLPEALQRQRATERGERSAEQVEAIIAAQWDRQERLARADDVIDNSGPWAATAEQVEALMERYRALAGERPA
jgi:dephospho-CoA kinase